MRENIYSLIEHWWILLGIIFIVVVLYFEGGLISFLRKERIGFWVRAAVGHKGE